MALIKTRILLKVNFLSELPSLSIVSKKFHNSSVLKAWKNDDQEPKGFLEYNKKIYPPQSPDEPPRPAVSVLYQNSHNK